MKRTVINGYRDNEKAQALLEDVLRFYNMIETPKVFLTAGSMSQKTVPGHHFHND